MSNEKSSVDDLAEQLKELTAAERAELFEGVQDDLLERYLQARGEYIDDLRERGVVGQYPEDSPWADYCREHPEDPLCHRILSQEDARERQREYIDARRKYVERLDEEGLMSFEMTPTFPGPTPRPFPGPIISPPIDICDRFPHLPWCGGNDWWRCLLNPCLPGCPGALTCDCIRWPWCDWGAPEHEFPPLGPVLPSGYGRGAMTSGQAAGGTYPQTMASLGAAAANPMLTPIPGPLPGPIIPPPIDICDRFPYLPWCDGNDRWRCLLNPCLRDCPGYFSCRCRNWPWCYWETPEHELPLPGPVLPSGYGRGAMAPGQAAGGTYPQTMASLGAAAANPMLTPIPGPIPGPGPVPGPIGGPVPKVPDPFPQPELDLCRRYPCLCYPHSCACNPYQPHCLRGCWTNPFTCECNPDLPWCGPWWGFPDPRGLGTEPRQSVPSPSFGGMTSGGTMTGSGYPTRSMGAYPYGY